MTVDAEFVVARKDNPTEKDIKLFFEKGYDVAASRVGKFVDVVISEEEFNATKEIYGLKIIDTEALMNKRVTKTDRQSDVGYMTYETYVSYLEQLKQTYPDIMKIYDVGDSEGKEQGISGYNHDIWMIKVSDNVEEEEAEPGYMFIGEHHARETQTFAVTYAILKHLLSNYGSDSKVTEYVDNNQIYVVPLVNPNGYTVARTKNSMWRKNINLNGTTFNPNSSFGQGSSVGVDLNRNYNFHWGVGSSSPSKTAETYRGPYSLSESECITMDSLMSCLNVQASISFHSYSEVILIPYSYSQYASPSDYTELRSLALDMADEMKDSWGRSYEVGTAESLLGYGAGGGMSDHMYANYGVFAYCFELWTAFQTPESSLPSLSNMCINAAEVMMDRSTFSTLRGIVTLDGEPTKAKVELSDVDDNVGEREDYYSYESTGLYVRFLPNGSYTLTVTLESEPDSVRVVENVSIIGNDVTIVDVAFGEVVEPDTLEITAPSAGDIYEQGKECSISWSNTFRKVVNGISCEFIDLALYNDEELILQIADSIENMGSYSWLVEDILSSDTTVSGYQIKVCSAIDSTVFDYSDEFSIYNDMTSNGILAGVEKCKLGITHIFDNTLTIGIPLKGDYSITLYNLNGKIIEEWNGNLTAGINKLTFDRNDISSQVIIAKILGAKIHLTEKLICK